MKRTPAQAGPFAAWLKRKRTDRYPRQADALADLRRLAGLAISPSEFAQWESGSRIPSEDNPKRLRLIEFFGGWPDQTEVEASDPGRLDASIPLLLTRIDALVAELQADRALIRELLRLSPSEPAVSPDVLKDLDEAERERRESASRRRRSGPSPVERQQSGVPAAR